MQVSEATQRPAVLQVWTAVPMQRLAPGLQSPVQAPFEQTAVQAVMLCQRPFWSQIWGILPRHCFAPGRQSPVQSPAPLHTNWHA